MDCKSRLSKFVSNTQGSVVIIAAVLLFLMIAVLMMTVDLSRVQSGKVNNQAAVDASVLGAAEYVTRYRIIKNDRIGKPQDITDYARKILAQNLSRDQSDANVSQNKDENGNIIEDFEVIIGQSITKNGQTFTATKDEILIYACLNVKTGFAATLNNGESKKVCNYSKASLP